MKKRILALMLVVMTVFMTACGGGAAYTPGTFTETGYETEVLGFRFTTPEGFVLSNSEELSQLMGVVLDTAAESGDVTELQKKYAEFDKKFSEKFLEEILDNCAKCDIGFKTGEMDGYTGLFLLVGMLIS